MLSPNRKSQIANRKSRGPVCGVLALLAFLVALRAGFGADPAAELWAAQGSVAPFADPIAAPPGFVPVLGPVEGEGGEAPVSPSDELKALAADYHAHYPGGAGVIASYHVAYFKVIKEQV